MSSFEEDLFVWDNWKEDTPGHFVFFNCKLLKNIGELNIQDKFQQIHVNFETGKINFVKTISETGSYEIQKSFKLEISDKSEVIERRFG